MFFISNALIIVHVLVSFHFTSTVFDSLVFPDLKDVEPAEGRLEFLAYLVNEEQHNQSVQVKNLRKQVPQTTSNTLTQFFIVSRLPKMPSAFSFFLSISVDMLSIYFTCIYLLSDTWMVPLTGLLDPAVLVPGTGWGGGEKEDVHGLLPGTHEPIEFPKKYMQIWYVKPLHLEFRDLERKTKPFKFKYCLRDIKF